MMLVVLSFSGLLGCCFLVIGVRMVSRVVVRVLGFIVFLVYGVLGCFLMV